MFSIKGYSVPSKIVADAVSNMTLLDSKNICLGMSWKLNLVLRLWARKKNKVSDRIDNSTLVCAQTNSWSITGVAELSTGGVCEV